MKNILLILTGGTIGSIDNNGIIGTKKGKCRILELASPYLGEFHFDVKQPMNILSENLSASHWESLVSFILSADLSSYDGIIITHGSDTLSYTSSMIGLTLHKLGIPIVLTAADRVPDDPESNAVFNFCSAARLISQRRSGIYTVYKNSGDDKASVFVPTRLIEADRFSDRFSSFDGTPAAFIDSDGCITEADAKLFSELESAAEPITDIPFILNKSVLMVKPYPLIDYRSIASCINERTGAVLHITYHSATVNENADILADECNKRQIPLYLCSFKRGNHSIYESSSHLLKKGALPLFDISSESAFAKLLLGINLFPSDLNQYMSNNIYHEICSK